MRYGSICSGIEAATVAWHPLGLVPAFFSEIEPAPRAVLAHHYPSVPLHGDFTTIQAGDYEPIDLLVGGTPCQDFSVAGLRAGLGGERGNLTLEYARLAQRLRPRWLVWENVPGVFSSNDGQDFGAVIACFAGYPEGTIFETPEGGWKNAGVTPPYSPDSYGLAWRVLDAQYAGVPQRRRRVFVVGYLGDWRYAAAVLFERESLSGNPPPRREAGQGFAADVAPSIGASGRGFERAGETRGQDPVIAVEPYTLAIRGRGESHDLEYRQDGTANAILTPNGGRAGIGVGAVAAFGGNNQSGPIDVATAVNAHGGPHGRQDFESETFVTHALRADGFDASEDGTGRGTPLVPVSFTGGASDCIAEVNLAHPVTGRNGDAGMVAFDTTQVTSKENRSNPQPGGPCHPLASGAHAPAVAFNITPSNSNKDYNARQSERAQAVTAGGNRPSARGGDLIVRSAVRRLTPRECERLQGFPDDYTLIPHRGKSMADGPRYKMLGNSMAVPCMRWIGERIDLVTVLTAEQVAA